MGFESLFCFCFLLLYFLYFFLLIYRVSARIWGFRNWGGPSKRPPKIFFSPAKAVVARFARASLQATEWRGEGCTRFDSSHVKLHSCVVW